MCRSVSVRALLSPEKGGRIKMTEMQRRRSPSKRERVSWNLLSETEAGKEVDMTCTPRKEDGKRER